MIAAFIKLCFFLYSAYDADTGKALGSVETMLADAEGLSLHGKDIPHEGLVWRTEDGSVHFKCKSRSYKVWFEG